MEPKTTKGELLGIRDTYLLYVLYILIFPGSPSFTVPRAGQWGNRPPGKAFRLNTTPGSSAGVEILPETRQGMALHPAQAVPLYLPVEKEMGGRKGVFYYMSLVLRAICV